MAETALMLADTAAYAGIKNMPQKLLDKHFLRKHRVNVYTGGKTVQICSSAIYRAINCAAKRLFQPIRRSTYQNLIANYRFHRIHPYP